MIETSDGKKYGMQHLYNLFFKNNEFAFTVQDFTEPHGNHPAYAHTQDLPGKTITKITYLLKDAPDKYVTCSVKVPAMSTAKISLAGENAVLGQAVNFTFDGVPSGVVYDVVSLYTGSGRNKNYITDYTYSNGALTINGGTAGDYTAIFRAPDYTDIAVTFHVEGYHYAVTDMTWAEFYAGELGTTASELETAGLDAVSSPTANIAGRFSQLTSESNDIGGRSITGVKAVQVRMDEEVYQLLSSDKRYTFSDTVFEEYKDVDKDGKFGEMFTLYQEVNNAVVTLGSGQNSTWGNYTLKISSVDISLTSGDERLDLGAILTTSDGKAYGLRHNSNLWFNASDVALSYKEFTEPHGAVRDYDYTSDLQGKTVTKIQFMLKNKPDVVISCSVYLKDESPAEVSFEYPEGYHGILAGTEDAVTFTFDKLPANTTYNLDSVTPSIRHAAALSDSMWDYKDDKLTFSPYIDAGKYKAVFTSEKYSDLSATVEVFTTDATSLLLSADKNEALLNFLLTPKGYIDDVDAELDENKFVNASDYTNIEDNTTAEYSAGVEGSGFTFDIAVNGVSDDYTAIVGFGKIFTMNRETLGSYYDAVFTKINSIPVGESGWKEIASFSELNSVGLRVIFVTSDGESRDISSLTGTGAMVSGDMIMFFYGVMAADSDSITEGEYTLSPEGETLINDGVRDGHIRVTMYIETYDNNTGGNTSGGGNSGSSDNSGNSGDGNSGSDTSGGSTGYEVKHVLPGTPSFNVEDTAEDIISALGAVNSKVTSDTKVYQLPASAYSNNSGITVTDTYAVPDEEIPAVALPVMSVDVEGIYVFKVDLSDLEEGALIFLHMRPLDKEFTGGELHASDTESDYVFLNEKGEETKNVPSSHEVNVAAYMEADTNYAPIITTTEQEISIRFIWRRL